RAYVEPLAARPGEEVLLGARPLRAKRPVYVDIHDTTGAWIDTIAPPFVGREPPRPWVVPAGVDGVVQIEAYSFINAPGESAEVARLQVTTRPSDAPASLEPLIELQRERLEIPRVEKDFDAALERAHLDRITKAELSAEEVATARAWLLGTLPIEVHEPPAAVATRAREEASVRARKHTWNAGIRLFLLAGGGLFLLVATILIARSYGRVARATQRALRPDGEAPDEDALFEEQVAIRAAQRAGLARGAALIATMALGVVLTVVVLDRLVWEFNDDAPAPAAVDAPIDPG
ncbi:MAG: hypothetical protein R3A51_21190, partial [Nannocystaceae bacterium]